MSFKNYLLDATQKFNDTNHQKDKQKDTAEQENNAVQKDGDCQKNGDCQKDEYQSVQKNTDSAAKSAANSDIDNTAQKSVVHAAVAEKKDDDNGLLNQTKGTIDIPQILNVLRNKMFKAHHELEISYANKLKAAIDLLEEGY